VIARDEGTIVAQYEIVFFFSTFRERRADAKEWSIERVHFSPPDTVDDLDHRFALCGASAILFCRARLSHANDQRGECDPESRQHHKHRRDVHRRTQLLRATQRDNPFPEGERAFVLRLQPQHVSHGSLSSRELARRNGALHRDECLLDLCLPQCHAAPERVGRHRAIEVSHRRLIAFLDER